MYKFNNQKGFGVEIEFLTPYGDNNVSQTQVAREINTALSSLNNGCRVESYNHITRPQWKIVSDSSVNGEPGYLGNNELVSPILRGQNGKKQLQVVLEVLKRLGCKVNRSCGIHIHHDVTSTMVKDKKSVTTFLTNLIKFVVKFEHIIYRLVSPSRLVSGWCRPARHYFGNMRVASNRNGVLKTIAKRIFKNVKTDVDNKFNNYSTSFPVETYPRMQTSRYCGLNLKNIWTRGSVEFRYMQGSLNFDKIWSWTVLTQAIINVTETNKSVSFKSVGNDLTGMFYFRKALGFIGSKERCNDVKLSNKITLKRYKDLTKQSVESRRTTSNFYSLTRAGI